MIATSDFRFLENIRSPDELNHLLLTIFGLPTTKLSYSFDLIEQSYLRSRFNGCRVPFLDIVKLAELFGFVVIEGGNIKVTNNGKIYSRANPLSRYETTPKQREILVRFSLFSNTEFSNHVDILLNLFNYNKDNGRFERVRSQTILTKTMHVQKLLFACGFFIPWNSTDCYINPEYSEFVKKKMTIARNIEFFDRKPTDEELAIANYAEEIIFEVEKKRLIEMKQLDLAENVELTCRIDSTAGYDISSYSGNASSIDEYDRFIEVKSSKDDDFQIYMSNNEMKKARLLRNKYHLVFVGGADLLKKIDECQIVEIQDPAHHFLNLGTYIVESKKFRVTKN